MFALLGNTRDRARGLHGVQEIRGALRAVRDVLHDNQHAYLVNEGANALDMARNVIDMHVPRHRLDVGTWGVMGIGMGYAIAAAVASPPLGCTSGSLVPWMTSVGTSRRRSFSVRSPVARMACSCRSVPTG